MDGRLSRRTTRLRRNLLRRSAAAIGVSVGVLAIAGGAFFVYRRRRQKNELKIIRAYFFSILDRYRESKQDEKTPTLTLFYNHKSWGSGGRMRIFAELVRQGELTEGEQAEFRELVSHSLLVNFPDYSKLELGVNNRPYGINAGPALAVQMFPMMPAATRHRPWLDALWGELVEYGDTTETNYFPYGPLYLQGLLDMAEGMGKFETERDFLYAHVRRYLDYVHGGGVRGNPNSGAQIIHDRPRLYADPWNAEYYSGAERVNDAHAWYRLAKHFRDPEFLWASEQALLGGRPPPGTRVPAEYMEAYRKRYGWFFRRGIRPRVPAGKSKIGYFSPLKHKIPDRLYLGPGRQSGKPFVSSSGVRAEEEFLFGAGMFRSILPLSLLRGYRLAGREDGSEIGPLSIVESALVVLRPHGVPRRSSGDILWCHPGTRPGAVDRPMPFLALRRTVGGALTGTPAPLIPGGVLGPLLRGVPLRAHRGR